VEKKVKKGDISTKKELGKVTTAQLKRFAEYDKRIEVLSKDEAEATFVRTVLSEGRLRGLTKSDLEGGD